MRLLAGLTLGQELKVPVLHQACPRQQELGQVFRPVSRFLEFVRCGHSIEGSFLKSCFFYKHTITVCIRCFNFVPSGVLVSH